MAKKTTSSISIAQTASVLPQQERRWGELGVHAYIKIAILGALLFSIFFNEVDAIVSRWLSDPSWSHGFLIPLFSLYFLNQHKEQILSLRTKPNYLGLVLLLAMIVFYPLNMVQFRFGYFNSLAMIAALGSIVLFLGGWKLLKYTWLPVAFLVFAVPLPQRYYVTLTIPMRKLAASIASSLLSMVNQVDAVARGVIIDVIHKGQRLEPPLDVAEACSGMRLLMAFMALGVAMAYLHYRPIWQRIVLLASTIPIAIFCNVIRVTVTGFIYVLWDPKYAQGLYHDLLGMMMLPLAFGMYGFLAWFMSSLFVDEDNIIKEDVIVRTVKD